jgi:hypothetical protein
MPQFGGRQAHIELCTGSAPAEMAYADTCASRTHTATQAGPKPNGDLVGSKPDQDQRLSERSARCDRPVRVTHPVWWHRPMRVCGQITPLQRLLLNWQLKTCCSSVSTNYYRLWRSVWESVWPRCVDCARFLVSGCALLSKYRRTRRHVRDFSNPDQLTSWVGVGLGRHENAGVSRSDAAGPLPFASSGRARRLGCGPH